MHILDFKGLTDWVEIFKGGEQTDSEGRAHHFTEAELDQIVANHDPAHPVPHVITHKELFSPFAYAQTKELKRDGLTLLAKSDKVEPQFEKLIKDGRLYERSIRLRRTDNGLQLHHIAWLGAEPPAVDGLAPVQFNKNDTDTLDFNLDHSPDGYLAISTLARSMRRLREFIISKFSIKDADEFLPDWEVDDLARRAGAMQDDKSFSRNGDTAVLTQADIDKAAADAKANAEAEFKKQQDKTNADFAAEREAFAKERAEFAKAGAKAFVDEQIAAGKLLPSQAEGAVEFMQQLPAADDAQFEFTRAIDKDKTETVKAKPADWFREFVKALPKQITLGNRKDDGADLVGGEAADIVKAAKDYQREQSNAGIEISNVEAIAHVKKVSAK